MARAPNTPLAIRERPGKSSGDARRLASVVRTLEMDIAHRLLAELGDADAEGNPALGGAEVQFRNGCAIVPWLGSRTNRIAEEFALRAAREAGCVIAHLSKGRVVDPHELQGERRPEVRTIGNSW